MPGLLNFLSKEQQDKIKESEANSLELKNNEIDVLIANFIKQGMTPEKAKSEAEIQLFKPKPLQQVQMQNTNINSGKRIKIFFFTTEEEYKKISEKYKLITQMEEQRIASSCTDEFIGKILS